MAANSNQTAQEKEAEFFAVATVGRKGLEEAVEKMTPEIMAVAAPDVAKAGGTWLKRAVISVANNDKLASVLKTRTGLFSVIKCFEKAATMGLQIGGQFPHAHLIPFDGSAELIVSAEGYRHAAIHGPGAVLADVQIERVYEGEDVKIDKGAGTVSHIINTANERGKLKGVYGIITKRDGGRVIDYMTTGEALKIRDAHSGAYKGGRSTPWKTDEDAMVEKTSAKKFLRKYAAESEGLAMLYSQETDDLIDVTDPPPRDVSDRMAAHLDRKASAASVAKEAAQDAEVVEEKAASQPESAAQPDGEVELF